MKKLGMILLVVCVFVALAFYRIRSAPLPLVVGMVPLLALALFLMVANPDDPNSVTTRILRRIGFYKVVQDVHASTQGGGTGGILIRALIVIAMLAWFWLMVKYFPA